VHRALSAALTPPQAAIFEHDAAGPDATALASETSRARVLLDAQVERLRARGHDASGALVRGPALTGIVEEVQAKAVTEVSRLRTRLGNL